MSPVVDGESELFSVAAFARSLAVLHFEGQEELLRYYALYVRSCCGQCQAYVLSMMIQLLD